MFLLELGDLQMNQTILFIYMDLYPTFPQPKAKPTGGLNQDKNIQTKILPV